MSGGIGQGIDDLELLDDRAGPAMGDDDRQRVFVLGPSVNEMNVEAIDLRDELRQCFQPRLALAPVVIGHPVAGEFLNRRHLDALCVVCYGLPFGPPSCGDAPAQVGELLIGDADSERTDCRLGRDVDGARLHAGCGHFLSSCARSCNIGDHIPPLPRHWHPSIDWFPHWSYWSPTGSFSNPPW